MEVMCGTMRKNPPLNRPFETFPTASVSETVAVLPMLVFVAAVATTNVHVMLGASDVFVAQELMPQVQVPVSPVEACTVAAITLLLAIPVTVTVSPTSTGSGGLTASAFT